MGELTQNLAYGRFIVSRYPYQVVEVCPGQLNAFDNGPIPDVLDTWVDIQIETTHTLPCHLRNSFGNRLAVFPPHFLGKLDDRPLDGGKWEDRQVDQELLKRVIKAAFDEYVLQFLF